MDDLYALPWPRMMAAGYLLGSIPRADACPDCGSARYTVYRCLVGHETDMVCVCRDCRTPWRTRIGTTSDLLTVDRLLTRRDSCVRIGMRDATHCRPDEGCFGVVEYVWAVSSAVWVWESFRVARSEMVDWSHHATVVRSLDDAPEWLTAESLDVLLREHAAIERHCDIGDFIGCMRRGIRGIDPHLLVTEVHPC